MFSLFCAAEDLSDYSVPSKLDQPFDCIPCETMQQTENTCTSVYPTKLRLPQPDLIMLAIASCSMQD